MSSPLVSCIMPTAGRPHFVPLAVHFFLRQSYPHRELIVVDDGALRIDHLIPKLPSIRYCRLERRRSLGDKRNLACELASGDVIAHWDDDDWIAPSRLSIQLEALESSGAAATGLSVIRYFDPQRRSAWLWRSDTTAWLAGGSLCYRKALWSAHPFRPLDAGEDLTFTHDVGFERFVDLGDADFYAAVIHGRNTSARPTSRREWTLLEYSEICRLVGNDLDLYAAIAALDAERGFQAANQAGADAGALSGTRSAEVS